MALFNLDLGITLVAGQALSETLLLITPRNDLYICSARMLHSIQHTLFPSFSVYNTRTLPCDNSFLCHGYLEMNQFLDTNS